MKKIFLLALTIIMVISFSACMGIPFLTQPVQQTQPIQTAQTVQTQSPFASAYPSTSVAPAEEGYQIINGNVVKTIYTGDIKQIFTYYFQYGKIVGADIVSICASSLEAQTMYDIFQKSNETSNIYQDIRMEGTTVTVDYSSIAIAAYSYMSPEQLKAYLEQSES